MDIKFGQPSDDDSSELPGVPAGPIAGDDEEFGEATIEAADRFGKATKAGDAKAMCRTFKTFMDLMQFQDDGDED